MFGRLRTYFFTGLLVLGPLAVTGYIVYRLFVWVDHLLGTTLRGGYIRPEGVPGLGFLTVVLIITITGALANNFLGRQLGVLLQSALMRVPVLRGIYGTLKEIGEALLGDRKNAFQRVVLVPYPRAGIYSIGLVAGDAPASFDKATGKKLLGIFIPTPPNPTTGPLVYYAEEELISTPLRVDQALKMVVSVGVVLPIDDPPASAGAPGAAGAAPAPAPPGPQALPDRS
ncbi:MAG TPA: DUF502 domain-containing protein [Candidatus Eisenbacteria bacterium]|nr:DUF502 domain-containing protein [Candidatus Eisenbacteria bacterium]